MLSQAHHQEQAQQQAQAQQEAQALPQGQAQQQDLATLQGQASQQYQAQQKSYRRRRKKDATAWSTGCPRTETRSWIGSGTEEIAQMQKQWRR